MVPAAITQLSLRQTSPPVVVFPGDSEVGGSAVVEVVFVAVVV